MRSRSQTARPAGKTRRPVIEEDFSRPVMGWARSLHPSSIEVLVAIRVASVSYGSAKDGREESDAGIVRRSPDD
jgi:hypothetical protein